MSARALRCAIALAWVAALAMLGFFVQQRLVIGTDLRLFMPTPQTPAQHLLLEEIGEGPASRLLLLAVQDAAPETLASLSRELVARLRADGRFRFVANGETDSDAIPDRLLAYRYVLSRTLDQHRFDEAFLRRAMEARVRDMGSPAASYLEAWLPSDPTLEILALVESWQPAYEPRKIDDVWFDRAGSRALLIVETEAAGFDPDAQRIAIDALRAVFDSSLGQDSARLVVSAPGAFAVRIKEQTQREATQLGLIATVGMVLLMLIAYRSPRVVAFGTLPLASAALAGLAAVSAIFGTVHGITLAFGATLIGVAQDYPIHLLSHQRPGVAPRAIARALWPTLATGVASTCIAYLAFLFSGVRGLAQLACFTIAGLAVAGLTTRFVLPALLGEATRDHADSRGAERLALWLRRLPHPVWIVPGGLALIVCAWAFGAGSLWENNLSALTPLPRDAIALDSELRAELGAPDPRYLLVIEASSVDGVLAREEQLTAGLDALVAAKRIAGYDLAARYLPSAATQARRRHALPAAAELTRSLAAALRDSPFEPAVFDPFIADVGRASASPPLTLAEIAGTPLAPRLGSLLLERREGAVGLVALTGVKDPLAVSAFATANRIVALDLKEAAESLVVSYRERIIASLGIAAMLLSIVVWIALRSIRRAARVLAPMAITTLLIVAVLHLAGVSLSLFHLIALVLAAGLGLDYALFFEHAGDDRAEHRRTVHALLVCSVSTLMVFALLASSSLPVLRAIGLTVSIGVVANFLLAALMTRRSRPYAVAA